MRRVAIIFFGLEIAKKNHANRKTLQDYFFYSKIMLDCNSFICKWTRLSNTRIMKNVVKKPTCK